MIKQVRSQLESSRYNFLNEKQELGNHIIYLGLSGSYGYGTYHEASDIDLRGCAIERPEVLYGLDSFEQYENHETDTVIYGLKKFARLALSANPNILELLGLPEDCIYRITDEGRLLRDNSHLFLSMKVADTFGGYAMAQLRRLQNALGQTQVDTTLRQKHIADTLARQIKQFNKDYTSFENGTLEVYVDEKTNDLKLNAELKDYPLRDFTGIYANMTNTLKSYEKLTHRNNKKEETKLHKHAMHLVRVLLTGTYILEGKGICTRLDEHIPMLLDIRHGRYSWEEVFKVVDTYEKQFNRVSQLSKLPSEGDYEGVNKMLGAIYRC